MPYLPQSYTQQTTFPAAFGKDLRMQVRMIDEQYRRMFPTVPYHVLQRALQDDADAPETVLAPIGEPGETHWDPLYGEALDTTIADSGAWEQPHSDAVAGSATDTKVFEPVVLVEGAKVQREVRDRDLKKYGFDKMRDILVTVPSYTFDGLGITARPGDEVEWEGIRYIVKQHKGAGYWKSTNIRLFRMLMCEMVRSGS